MTDNKHIIGRVALVGAGPGDVGLLTLRGKSWIERADTILYDHLVNRAMMRFAKSNVEKIYVGKIEGHKTMPQSAINELLIEKALAGKTVVRLKGGDPFIFGRGGEEAQALKQASVPFIVIPGITSAVGVPAYAGIPLTHRDFSSSVSIITGSSEKNHEGRIDWEKIASRSGTLVFLMGARKLPTIVENLIRFGKEPNTPVAVIQWGTTARQKTWTGTLTSIVEIAMKEKISPPALTVIGEVVDLKSAIEWYESQPLAGKTIVVTRAGNQSESFFQLLQDAGAEAFPFPVIQTVAPESWAPLDEALSRLRDYDGLIFTSTNGVKFFLQRLRETRTDIRELHGVRIYTIGPKTEDALAELGIQVDVVPQDYVAESLIESLRQENIHGKHFLLPRAKVARETLPEEIRTMGAKIDVVPTYQTILPDNDKDDLVHRLQAGTIDTITFTSSSTVTHFMQLLGAENHPLLKEVHIACIGPVTADTAKKNGLNVDIIPQEYTVDGLATAIREFYTKSKSSG
jgi:uroporphyrinogen III methyltransferase/synthase